MQPPPTREQWAVDGELYGHSPAETFAYFAWCADHADEVERRRAMPAVVIPTPGEAWRGFRQWLRRLFH